MSDRPNPAGCHHDSSEYWWDGERGGCMACAADRRKVEALADRLKRPDDVDRSATLLRVLAAVLDGRLP